MQPSPVRFQTPEALTIAHVRELSAGLSTTLQGAEWVEVDLHQVAEVDVAGIQLLIAAARSAQRGNKRLTLAGLDRDVMRHTLARLGLLGADGEARTGSEAFWSARSAQEEQHV